MDEQDLQEQIRLLVRTSEELNRTNTFTVETFESLRNSTNKFKQSVEKAEDALYKFNKSGLGKTSKAVGDFAKGIGSSALAARDSRESFASLNPVIDAAASALGAIPIVGEAAGKVVAAIGKFATDELDKSVKAFQTLGSVGGIAGEGVTGLRESAQQAGLSFQQLASVTGNKAGGLAFAFGSTATGLQQIAELTKAAEPFRNELLALGFNLQDQSETFVDYIDRSRRLGRAQERDQRVLAQNSAEYAKNLTDLSRLTGMSVDSAQSELDAQMSNIRFRRAMTGLDEDIQESVSNVGVVIAGIGKDPALTQGFQDLVAGFGTQAGRDFSIATGGVGEQVAAQLKAGAITEQEAIAQIQAALKATYEKLPAQVFGAGTPFDNVSLGMANLATATIDFGTALEQGKKAAGAEDVATEQMVNAQRALQGLAQQTDDFVNSKVFPRAVDIVGSLASAMESTVGKINQLADGTLGTGTDGTAGGAGGFFESLGLGALSGAGVGALGGGPLGALVGAALGAGFAGYNALAGARAEGGPVDPNKPYLVGEEGPELVIPEVAANVFTARETQQALAKISSVQSLVDSLIPRIQQMDPGENIELTSGATFGRAGITQDTRDIFGYGGMYSLAGAHGKILYDRLGKWTRFDFPAMIENFNKSFMSDGNKAVKFGFSGGANEYLLDAQNNLIKHYVKASFGGVMQDRLIDLLERTVTTGENLNYARADGSFGNMYTRQKMSFAKGGIASGPKTGYSAMLHGTEAVVPLPDGKSIPVEVKNSESNSELATLMQNMNQLLQQVASNTRTGADTSKKLLRASTA